MAFQSLEAGAPYGIYADFAVAHCGSSFLNMARVKLLLGLKISAE